MSSSSIEPNHLYQITVVQDLFEFAAAVGKFSHKRHNILFIFRKWRCNEAKRNCPIKSSSESPLHSFNLCHCNGSNHSMGCYKCKSCIFTVNNCVLFFGSFNLDFIFEKKFTRRHGHLWWVFIKLTRRILLLLFYYFKCVMHKKILPLKPKEKKYVLVRIFYYVLRKFYGELFYVGTINLIWIFF